MHHFNQFDEFGNSAWHYNVTGHAIEEAYNIARTGKNRLAAYVSATGSAGQLRQEIT
jgi:cysteine synthase